MITKQLLRDWDACHQDAELTAMARGRTSASPREIASDEAITLDDRLWVVCRSLWYRDEAAAREFAIDSAALVSRLAGRPEDCAEHARLVEDLRRIFAIPRGDRRSEELQRWEAAWAAARDAARAAAWDAELRQAIDRALIALGPDADGWTVAPAERAS